MNTNEIKLIAQDLNTSTTEWMRALAEVTSEYRETTLTDVEDMLQLAVEKRDQAQALVELLCDEEDRIRIAETV
jgi:hypothetical protein